MTTNDKTREALANLLRFAERNTCTHESTHRGGAIWTICDSCGAKWADDEGGFPGFEEPTEFEAAREALAIAPTEAAAQPPVAAVPEGVLTEDEAHSLLNAFAVECAFGDAEKRRHTAAPIMARLPAATPTPAPTAQGEVIAWYRPCSDGTYEGPLMDCDRRVDDVRRKSGAWVPLGRIAAPERAEVRPPVLTPQAEYDRGFSNGWDRCGESVLRALHTVGITPPSAADSAQACKHPNPVRHYLGDGTPVDSARSAGPTKSPRAAQQG